MNIVQKFFLSYSQFSSWASAALFKGQGPLFWGLIIIIIIIIKVITIIIIIIKKDPSIT